MGSIFSTGLSGHDILLGTGRKIYLNKEFLSTKESCLGSKQKLPTSPTQQFSNSNLMFTDPQLVGTPLVRPETSIPGEHPSWETFKNVFLLYDPQVKQVYSLALFF